VIAKGEVLLLRRWISGIHSFVGETPDLFAIFVWAAIVTTFGALRVDFMGDGIRHLQQILANTKPSLGEPRWLLFPALLFFLVKPLQAVGLVATVEQAARAFVAFDLLAGFSYMLLIRTWLIARGAAPLARAGALVLAGMTVPMLQLSSNTAEVIIPATIALAGLVYLATRQPGYGVQGLMIAAVAVTVASLLYQGLILAVALVPLALPRAASIVPTTVLLFCGILAPAPATMLIAMTANGVTGGDAMRQITTGMQNELYKAEMKSKTLPVWPYIAALTAGPAENLVTIPRNRGIRGCVKLMSRRATLAEGIFETTGFLFALSVLFTSMILVARRREWRITAAFMGMSLLPVVWSFEYSYVKFYVLMPVIVAIVAAGESAIPMLAVGLAIGSFNSVHITREIMAGRRLSQDITPIFQRAGASACFVTTSWGPPAIGWPGSVTSMNAVFSQGHSGGTAATVNLNNRAMIGSLRRCFCDSSAVLTDDIVDSSADAVVALAANYEFSGLDLTEILWNADRGNVIFERDDRRVLIYSRQAQTAICSKLVPAADVILFRVAGAQSLPTPHR
jgi:hypothetical protein